MAKLKRLGVLNTAYFLGLYGVLIGLIAAILMGIASLLLSSLFSTATVDGEVGTMGILSFSAFSWIYLLIFPIVYGIFSFILGLIFTPLANLVLKIIKGIDLELVDSSKPQVNYKPQQYNPNYPPQNYSR